jgi:hypothetical protein
MAPRTDRQPRYEAAAHDARVCSLPAHAVLPGWDRYARCLFHPVASFVYLAAGGQGVGIAGKVLMDGLYQSFILLAVPLFIVAANIMNAGTISDRLLQFCVAAWAGSGAGSAMSTSSPR